MTNKKIASEIAIGIIILLAITIGGIFWLQNKNQAPIDTAAPIVQAPATQPVTQPAPVADETANWQTYINNRVGYSFEYSTNNLALNLEETIKYPSSRPGDSKQKDLVQFGSGKIVYSVETEVGINKKTIEEWIQDGDYSHSDNNLMNYTKETVGNKTAYIQKDAALAFVLSGNNVYKIIARDGVAPTSNINDLIFKHILSTFKFIN